MEDEQSPEELVEEVEEVEAEEEIEESTEQEVDQNTDEDSEEDSEEQPEAVEDLQIVEFEGKEYNIPPNLRTQLCVKVTTLPRLRKLQNNGKIWIQIEPVSKRLFSCRLPTLRLTLN